MPYTHGIKWNDDLIEQKIKEVVNTLQIDHFPTHTEMIKALGKTSLCKKVSDKGTLFWAEKMGLPIRESETYLGNSYEIYAITDIFENTELLSVQTSSRHPYDLLTDSRVKIDVKVSKGFTNNCNSRAFTFNLEKKEPTCDLFLLYCVDDNGTIKKRLIIPSFILIGQTQVGVGDVSKWDKYMDRWEFIVKIDEFYKNLVKDIHV